MLIPRPHVTAVLAAAALTACAGAGEEVPATEAHDGPVVQVRDNSFSPDTLEVAVGETVVWDLGSARQPHNVVFDDGPSSEILEGGTWDARFTEPGTYTYECTLHSGMTASIVVAG